MIYADKWGHLPEQMRSRAQWAIAGASKAPMALGPDGKLRNVSVNRPSEWMTFEIARQLAWDLREAVTTHVTSVGVTVTKTGYDIGYIINETDPLTCIDLDVKDAATHPANPELWTTPETFDFYMRVVTSLDTYTERSRSGKGLHMWALGNIGRGFKRDGIEVYSRERFIICTGDIWQDKPVANRHEMLLNMVSQMRPAGKQVELTEFDPECDDWYIFSIAATAANSEKFWQLWYGRWQEQYKSQSEADLALMSMFTFYTDSNEQCRRLFRDSALGKREKAVKNNYYVNKTLSIVRTRQEREASVDMSAIKTSAENMLAMVQRMQAGVNAAPIEHTPFGPVPARTEYGMHVTGLGDPVQIPPPVEGQLAQLAPVSASVQQAGETGLPWPPGLAGAISKYVYSSTIRPVKEVAIVAALGLLAGISGRAYQIPQSGLNLYIILVGRSAIGKEAMSKGVGALTNAVAKVKPTIRNYVEFNEAASGPALIKQSSGRSSYVNICGEWGRKLKRMSSEDGRDGPLMSLRTELVKIYQKSDADAIVGGISYSAIENNIESSGAMAYSMIGETTPGTYYEAITPSMMEDGFLSRFLMISYDGDRPDRNDKPLTRPDETLINSLASLVSQVEAIEATSSQSLEVERTEDAAAMLLQFSDFCDDNIKSTPDDESRRQMWNRAELKALRIAGLLAVADNWITPVTTVEHCKWAIDVVMRDVNRMKERLDGGDVGVGDDARERKLMGIIQSYLMEAPPPGYKIPPGLRENNKITKQYIAVKTGNLSPFKNHKLGHNKSLIDCIESCISMGYLRKVDRSMMVEQYNTYAETYQILSIPDYETMSRKIL